MSASIVKTISYAAIAPPLVNFERSEKSPGQRMCARIHDAPPLVRSFPRSSVGMQPWAHQRPHADKGCLGGVFNPTKSFLFLSSRAKREISGTKEACRIHDDLPRCDRSHPPAWECSPGRSNALIPPRVEWVTSPNWRGGPPPSVSLREGHSFLCLPKEKKQKKGQPCR